MFTGKFGQWTLQAGEEGYSICNFGEDGKKRFYEVRPGKYGEPRIIPEPDLAFPVPTVLVCVNAKGEPVVPPEKISGIICKDSHRWSLTNAQIKGISITVNEDGSLAIGGETWWIATLFSKDKNRFENYDAYCVKEKPEKVRVIELGDLDLF